MTATPEPVSSRPPVAAPPGRPGFRERLWPGPLGWGGAVGFGVVLGLAFVPVDTLLALVVGTLALLGGLAGAVLTTPVVEVERGTLRAGTARIPVRLLAAPRVLDRAALRTELGPALDARAYACLRSWIGTAVRVEIRDPQDPTPYWIVSTRRPDALVAALAAARPAAPTPNGAAPRTGGTAGTGGTPRTGETPGTTTAGHPVG